MNQQALLDRLDVVDVQAHQLGAPQGAGEAQQQDEAVPGVAGRGAQRRHRGAHVGGGHTSFLAGATPRLRRIPVTVSRTRTSVHGWGCPATLWPSPMAATRRVMVDTAAGARSSGGSAISAT